MFGKHIGELIVYMATHSSETIVWHVSGNQGNSWLLAQTTLQADSRYKVQLMTQLDDQISSYACQYSDIEKC